MTEIAVRRRAGGQYSRLAARVARLQRQWSDHGHADGDAFARKHVWAISATSGRLGFCARVYPDPRFGQRVAATRRDEPQSNLRSRRTR
jgi:hypothetical protein